MPGVYNRKDHLYRKAKDEGYRSRAAYKLEEIDKKYRLLKKGYRVVDLGCAPGGWLQVAAKKVGSDGMVLGVDLERVSPFRAGELANEACQPRLLVGDMNSAEVQAMLLSLAAGPVDVVLSDMSPKLSGIRERDQVQSVALCESALTVCGSILRPGGSFVAKIFPSEEAEDFAKRLGEAFRKSFRVHAKSSRKTSTELYLVGLGFRPAASEGKEDVS
ncbi:MAG: RlmE family RNA methyltransferase [Bdellovibrionales bacterium]|nr:RlmE family RNA methyltransferase [Bdellovibrionales bacterium]